MRPVIRRIVPLVAVLALTVGCGPENAGEAEPVAYAKDVCAALATWQRGVTSDSQRLSKALQARGADLATVKARYTDFFASAVRRTNALLATVTEAGAPKVDDGVDFAEELDGTLTEAKRALAAAQRRFAGLRSDNLAAYARGAERILDDLGTVLLGLGQSLDRINRSHSAEALEEAFTEERACRDTA